MILQAFFQSMNQFYNIMRRFRLFILVKDFWILYIGLTFLQAIIFYMWAFVTWQDVEMLRVNWWEHIWLVQRIIVVICFLIALIGNTKSYQAENGRK